GAAERVVGLFPSARDSFGGVQLSGFEAWRSVVNHVGDNRAHALLYEAGTSKLKAVLGAVGIAGRADLVLVWHLDLLKLLPFLDSSAARVAVFLHGIEAWRRQAALTHFLLKKVDLFLANSEFTWTRFMECNPAIQGA